MSINPSSSQEVILRSSASRPSASGIPRSTTPPPSTAVKQPPDDTPSRPSSTRLSEISSASTRVILDPLIQDELRGAVFSTPQFYELFLNDINDGDMAQMWPSLKNFYDDSSKRWKTAPHRTDERSMIDWVTRICADFIEALDRPVLSKFGGSGAQPLKEGEANRKPDCFLIHTQAKPLGHNTLGGPAYKWEQLRVVAELKSNAAQLGIEDGTCTASSRMVCSLARYAREIFGAQPGRRFLHAFSLCGMSMRNYMFDRSGALCSYSFDVNEDPSKFVRCMLSYLTMSSESLGFDSSIHVGGGSSSPETIYDITVPGSEEAEPFIRFMQFLPTYTLHPGESGTSVTPLMLTEVKMHLNTNDVICNPSIASRGTTCWRARLSFEDPTTWNYFVKDQWRNSERRNEGELLEMAKGVQGVVEHFHHEDVSHTPDVFIGVRKNLDPNHLLIVVIRSQSTRGHSSSYSGNTGGSFRRSTLEGGGPSNSIPSNTRKRSAPSSLIQATPQKRHRQEGPVVVPYNRTHTRLIMRGVGRRLSEARSLKELLTGIRDAILGHRELHDTCDILHRDISKNNILLSDDGHGFLIDLDYACHLSSPRLASGAPHRTGTQEFMAIDVLERTSPHTFRHDLESFFYVLIWMLSFYTFDPTHPERGLEQLWFKDDDRLVCGWGSNAPYIVLAYLKRSMCSFRILSRDFLSRFADPWCDEPYQTVIKELFESWRSALFPFDPDIGDFRTDTTEEQKKSLYADMIAALDAALEKI